LVLIQASEGQSLLCLLIVADSSQTKLASTSCEIMEPSPSSGSSVSHIIAPLSLSIIENMFDCFCVFGQIVCMKKKLSNKIMSNPTDQWLDPVEDMW
jgi:hypothetical protein